MNKELKEHIDSMDDDEKYSYSLSLRFLGRLIDIIGISIILFVFLFPNLLMILCGTAVTVFFAIVGSTMKQALIYIEEKLKLR